VGDAARLAGWIVLTCLAPAAGQTRPGEAPAASPADPERFWAAHCSPAGRSAAEADAREDALRRLGETVRRARLAGEATLADVVAASRRPDVDVRTFLRGARIVQVRPRADRLVVEAEADVRLVSVAMSLKAWAEIHYTGPRETLRRLEETVLRGRDEEVRQVGFGCPPAEEVRGLSAGERAALELARAAPAWVTGELRARGPVAEDARRALAQMVAALPAGDGTTVGEFFSRAGRRRETLERFLAEQARPAAEAGAVEVPPGALWELLLDHAGRGVAGPASQPPSRPASP